MSSDIFGNTCCVIVWYRCKFCCWYIGMFEGIFALAMAQSQSVTFHFCENRLTDTGTDLTLSNIMYYDIMYYLVLSCIIMWCIMMWLIDVWWLKNQLLLLLSLLLISQMIVIFILMKFNKMCNVITLWGSPCVIYISAVISLERF